MFSYFCQMRYLIIVIVLLFAHTVTAQNGKPAHPKLVVGIVIDQMRPDYLTRFYNRFGSYGFKRILKEGYHLRNAQFNYAPTYTGPGHASIYTGTTPAVHGIAGNDWYDSRDNDTVYCTQDNHVRPVGCEGTEGRMSPARMIASTISDQLRLSTRMKSKVIGISLKDRGAILPAGRSGNAAYWYEGRSGNWVSSSWYMTELPKWVHSFNDRCWPDEYLSRPWKTVFPLSSYSASDRDDSPFEAAYRGETNPIFPHDLPSLRGNSYDLLRRTPFGNTLTKDFALAAIQGEQLGTDSITDFLCISFSATDYIGHQFGPNSIETEDTYIRLDRDLADLLTFLDNRVGKGNYLLFITADHACAENPGYLMDHKLAAGYASPRKTEDTLRHFLKTKYGKEEYFRCYLNEQVYFNEELIRNDNLSVCTMETEASEFLQRSLEGIADVIPGCYFRQEEYNGLFRNRIQRGYFPGRSGNICLLFAPGWTEPLYGTDGTKGTTHGSPYPYDAHVPLLWFGWNIPSGSSLEEVQITDIAPTLSFLLKIPLPNGCTGKRISSLVR